MSKKTPNYFICPITCLLMNEPVIDPEGNTYEKYAIEKWLSIENISPITRNKLNKKDLIFNRSLKEAIIDYNKKKIKLKPLPQLKPLPPLKSLKYFSLEKNKK